MKSALLEFTSSWNHHNVQTAGLMTPTHLFCVGTHNIQRRAGLEGIHFPELDEVVWFPFYLFSFIILGFLIFLENDY